MQHKIKIFFGFIFFALTLTACEVGPDYMRSTALVSPSYKEAKGKTIIGKINKKNPNWKVAHPQDTIDRGRWWEIFGDKRLNRLEERLMIANQNIISAYYNYKQACNLIGEAAASFFPTLTATASATRQKQVTGAQGSFVNATSTTGASGTSTTGIAASSKSPYFTVHSLIFNASWEPDIWGSVQRNVEANVEATQSSAALLAATQLTSQASLAQFYFQLRTLDLDQRILDNTVIAYKKSLQITQNRYAAGVVTKGDVLQALTQLESAQANAINNKINRGTFEHAIAVLIGVPPGSFSLPFIPLAATPPAVPLKIPSALLERRPDVAQAERLMAQANAQIGVAISAYFPTLTLSGTASLVGKGLSLSFPGFGWSYGPQLMATLLDGGLRTATVGAARTHYFATVASYRQTVLTALQDVEDNLVSLRVLNEEAPVLRLAASNANKALQIVMNEYKAGTVLYSDVIIAQTTYYNAEKTAADLNGQSMVAAVNLVRALGGGWRAASLNCLTCCDKRKRAPDYRCSSVN